MVYHEFSETEKENDEHVGFLKLKEKMDHSEFSETEKEIVSLLNTGSADCLNEWRCKLWATPDATCFLKWTAITAMLLLPTHQA